MQNICQIIQLYLIMNARDIILLSLKHIIIAKAHVKFKPDWLDFLRKGEISKMHNFMPSYA